MTWLVLGLFTEGRSDSRFLPYLIYREVLDQILERGIRRVELQEQILLFDERDNGARAKRICDDANYVDLFIIHSDASRTGRDQAWAGIIDGIRQAASQLCGFRSERIIPLIPAREMEAWALCDPDAIAKACGFDRWPDAVQKTWDPARPELVEDPKACLEGAIQTLHGGRRGRRVPKAAGFLDQIAQEIDLQRLRRVASFGEFKRDLLIGLVDRSVIAVE